MNKIVINFDAVWVILLQGKYIYKHKIYIVKLNNFFYSYGVWNFSVVFTSFRNNWRSNVIFSKWVAFVLNNFYPSLFLYDNKHNLIYVIYIYKNWFMHALPICPTVQEVRCYSHLFSTYQSQSFLPIFCGLRLRQISLQEHLMLLLLNT